MTPKIQDQLIEEQASTEQGQVFALFTVIAMEHLRGQQCYICTRKAVQSLPDGKYQQYDADNVVTIPEPQIQHFKLFSLTHENDEPEEITDANA